jgi:REP-associated tyrosine transposase
MGRPLRIEYPGAWYHVINRGAGRQRVFHSDRNRELFMNLLADVSQIYSVQIHAYSLMDNHYHLLIHTPRGGLSRAMRHLNGVYTQKANRTRKSDGPLFRGRYKALLVQSDEYLLELVRYIHMNPVEAGLCRHPSDHRWTSHRAYLFKGLRPKWLATEEVLGRFGRSENEALRKMSSFVCAKIPESVRKGLLEERVILGTKAFKEWVHDNWRGKKRQAGIALRDQRLGGKADIKTILEHVAHAFNVSVSDLRTSGRFQENTGRKMAIDLLRRLGGLSQNEIAKWMKANNGAVIAKASERYRQELGRDRSLRKLYEEVAHQIMSYVRP